MIAETAQDQIFVISREDRVEYVNRSAAEQLRAAPESLIGRRRDEIFPPEVAERQKRNIDQVLNTGRPMYIEGRTMYREREVWLGTWLAPLADGDGSVRGVIGFSRDITERKRAEEALRATEQRLHAVLSNTPLVLWATNREGVFTFCAGQRLHGLGLSGADIVGRTSEEVRLDPSRKFNEHVGRALAGETFRDQLELQALSLEASCAPLRNERGEITGAIGVALDITERRRLEEYLANSQKMEAVGRLAGGIAHDFNNNLTAILGYTEMILSQIGDDKPISADLREVQRAAERAAGLIRRLLAFASRQVFQLRTLDLNEVIAGMRPMLERLIGEGTQVVVHLAPDLPLINGDPSHIEQVIMNLVLNARDAMPTGGIVTIETRTVVVSERDRQDPVAMPPGRYSTMSVSDIGVGMDARTKERLFEPFFTTKPVGQGTGLGLSAVYGIVTQLTGFISVESQLGHGSIFKVSFPATEEAAAESAPYPAQRSRMPAVVRRATIILVEDEETVRRFARLVLERHGFRIVEAATGREALSLAAAFDGPIDLLLTDVVMPGIGGPELATQLKTARPGLPVLYMSGYAEGIVGEAGVLDSSVSLLAKPFTTADLLSRVEGMLPKA
jgi:PAS domain S-box-containing protein